MIRKISVVGGVLGILLLSFFAMDFLSSQKEEAEKPPVKEAKRYVRTENVAYQPIDTEIDVYGRVASSLPLDITSEVQGKILNGDVPLKDGQRFRKGQLLFRIDKTEREYSLKGLKSSFMRDIAGILPDMKIDYPDSYPAWQAYFEGMDVDSPLKELPSPKNSQEKTFLATKNILNSYYSIKSQEVNLKKHEVYAPFSGTISQVLMQVGGFANPGAKVAKLLQTSSLELRAGIEASNAKWIKQGAKVTVSTEDGQQTWQGRINRIGDVINPNTQALDVFIQLSQNKNRIYEGMYLKATIPGSNIAAAMEVPRAALFNDRYVYTVKDSVLKVNAVQVHKLNSETAVISGLKPGASLVMEPLVNAYEDMKVFKLSDRKEEEMNASL